MANLDSFSEKEMMEQMVILEEVKERGEKEAIPPLIELLAEKKCEQATHEMIYHTLFELMADDPNSIKGAIRHPSFRVQLLGIRRCRKSRLTEAKEDLIATLEKCSDNEVIGEIIKTLGSFRDPALLPVFRPYLFHQDPTILGRTMEALGVLEKSEIKEMLINLIKGDKNLEADDRKCNLSTVLAVEHLARMENDEARRFLDSLRNHHNPHLRHAVAKAQNLDL